MPAQCCLPGLALACLFAAAAAAAAPNIVVILADDLGWHDVGYHGSDISTPALDELAGSGVTLDNYYVQPLGSGTRSALLTGKYQISLGNSHEAYDATKPVALPLDAPTLAEKLAEAGYQTHMVGKWGVGHYTHTAMPTHRGFHSFFGKLTGEGDHYNYSACVSLGGAEVCGADLYEGTSPVSGAGAGQYSTLLYTSKATQRIREHDTQQPLFLYVSYQAPHAPLQVPQKYSDMYAHIQDNNRRVYAGMVSCLDDAVKNITDTLKEQGIWENTLLLFSTDNGGIARFGGSNYPLKGEKGSMHEGGIRGVGLLHGGVVEALPENLRTTSTDLIHVTDWFPSLLYVAGHSANGVSIDGVNIWHSLSLGIEHPRTDILHHIDILHEPGEADSKYADIFDTRIRAAIRVGKWKLLTGIQDSVEEDAAEYSDADESDDEEDEDTSLDSHARDSGASEPALEYGTETGDGDAPVASETAADAATVLPAAGPGDAAHTSTPEADSHVPEEAEVSEPKLDPVAESESEIIDDVTDSKETDTEIPASPEIGGTNTEVESSSDRGRNRGGDTERGGRDRGGKKRDRENRRKNRRRNEEENSGGIAKRSAEVEAPSEDIADITTAQTTASAAPVKSVWLYNIMEDPQESVDLSDTHPEVVAPILLRLSEYLDSSVPPVSPCVDPKSNPERNGGVWGPWMTKEDRFDTICVDLIDRYHNIAGQTKEPQLGPIGEAPGIVLLLYMVLIGCILLIGTILGGRYYLVNRKRKLKMEIHMQHE